MNYYPFLVIIGIDLPPFHSMKQHETGANSSGAEVDCGISGNLVHGVVNSPIVGSGDLVH